MKHANLKRFSRTSALVVALGILASQGAPVEAVLRKDQRKAMNTYILKQVKKDPEFWSRGAFGEDREALRLVLLVRAICEFVHLVLYVQFVHLVLYQNSDTSQKESKMV